MQVILIRHAEAVDGRSALDDIPDALRPLTPHGRVQATCLGDRLRWYDCAATHVWTSPYARAVETASLIVSMMTDPVPVEQLGELAPPGSPRAIADAIAALPARSAVMCIGHEPTLSTIGALLSGISDFGPMARARAVRIVDGRLRWHFDWDAEAPSAYR